MPVLKIKSSSSPKLRFKEFKSKFVKTTLNEISTIKIGYGLSRETLEKNGKNKCIFYGDLFTKYNPINPKISTLTNEKGKIFSTKNNLLFASRYSNNNTFFKPVSLNEESVLIGNFINLLEIDKNFYSDYISLYFWSFNNAKTVYKILEGSLAQQLHAKYLKNIEINISENLLEQNKIVTFFTKILEKIDLEKNLKNKWEIFLKSLNEKTFEKNKDINKYYIFNEKINVFFDSYSGLSGIPLANFLQNGDKFLPYTKIYIKKVCNSSDLKDFKVVGKTHTLLKKDDILVTSMSETQYEIGISSVYDSEEEAFLSGFTFGLRLRNEFLNKVYPKYVNMILSWGEYKKMIFPLSQGSTRFCISKLKFVNLKIKLPNYATQVKISKVYYGTHRLIEIQTKLVKKMELLKKYFLNSMFPTT